MLLGLDNPHSKNPRAALLPRPPGSAGQRLFLLSKMGWSEYRRSFERKNACDLLEGDLEHRTVLVLGKEAWKRLGLPGRNYFDRLFSLNATFVLLPHPSGRNLWYNSATNRNRVTRLMRRVADEWTGGPSQGRDGKGRGGVLADTGAEAR
jgi:hypothetical protein